MTRIGSLPESREPVSIAPGSRHDPRVSDVSAGDTPAAFGTRGMTRYVYGRELDIIVCTFGARVAGAGRRRPLSRLAPAYGSRKRPGRSKQAPLYLLAAGLDGSCDFVGGEGRSPQTTIRLRLARGHQRTARVGRSVPSREVAGRHPPYAPTVLFGHRLVAGVCREAILATSACQGRRFARVPSAARYGDVALCAPKRPPSLSFAPSFRTSAPFPTRDSLRSRGPKPFRFRQGWRHEVRAFDAPAPHQQRIASAQNALIDVPAGRGGQG